MIRILLVSFVHCSFIGLIFANYLNQFRPIARPLMIEERNAQEWRGLCRNFSHGDMSTGEFSTPNFPDPYPANLECIRLIHSPVDYTILLDFRGSFFEMENSDDRRKWRLPSKAISTSSCPFDYLEVRNGAYGFSPLLGRYCGDRFPPVVAADSGSMWLMFHSDNSIQRRGFNAIHYASPKVASPSTRYRNPGCSFTITASDNSDGTFGTEDIQRVYAEIFANRSQNSPIECIWKVHTHSNSQHLRLFFDTFDLLYPNECNLNSLEIYAFTTSKNHLVKQLCGRIASYVDTRSSLAYVRMVLSEQSFMKTVIKAAFIPYARGKDCNDTMFSCGADETCIPRSLVCNGRADCLSGLDERKCGKPDRALFNFFNSPYLAILIIILLLIVSIVSCAVVINVWHRIKKRRILYTPVQRSESSCIFGKDAKMPQNGTFVPEPRKLPTPIELVYSTHVPGPVPYSASNSRLCELLPSISTGDDLRLYLCKRACYVDMDPVKMARVPQVVPTWEPSAKSPPVRLSCNTGVLSSQLWTNPSNGQQYSPAESTLAYCSSQSAHSGMQTLHKKKKRKKLPKLSTSKAYYQQRSSSSSTKNDFYVPSHKFWSRVEDLITTTEESDAGCKSVFHEENAANLSDLPANRESSAESEDTDTGTRCPNDDWILNEADSILESESMKMQCSVPGELVLSIGQ